MSTPSVGRVAPAFTLLDQHSEKVRLSALKGRRVLVYFYPRADTPGCTTQACGLRDIAAEIGDTAIIGVRPDTPAKLAKFDGKSVNDITNAADGLHALVAQYVMGHLEPAKGYGNVYVNDAMNLVEQVWRRRGVVSPRRTYRLRWCLLPLIDCVVFFGRVRSRLQFHSNQSS